MAAYVADELLNDHETDDIWMYVESVLHTRQQLIKHPALGAAYGTAKSGIGIAGVGTYRPDLIMKVCDAFVPPVQLMIRLL